MNYAFGMCNVRCAWSVLVLNLYRQMAMECGSAWNHLNLEKRIWIKISVKTVSVNWNFAGMLNFPFIAEIFEYQIRSTVIHAKFFFQMEMKAPTEFTDKQKKKQFKFTQTINQSSNKNVLLINLKNCIRLRIRLSFILPFVCLFVCLSTTEFSFFSAWVLSVVFVCMFFFSRLFTMGTIFSPTKICIHILWAFVCRFFYSMPLWAMYAFRKEAFASLKQESQTGYCDFWCLLMLSFGFHNVFNAFYHKTSFGALLRMCFI